MKSPFSHDAAAAEEAPASAWPGAERAAPPALGRPRPRAVLLGAVSVIALALLIPYFNYSLGKFDWAFRPLATGPVFFLFIFALPVNALLRRVRPRWAFTGSELLLIYAMMAISAALSNEGLFGYVTVNSVHPRYFASPENRWLQLISPNVPTWLQVNQLDAATWFFEGKPAGVPTPWAPWIAPVLAWTVFALALCTAFFALGCLLRKDWIEGQRLAFPIAALPIEMAGGAAPSAAGAFFRSPLLWAGFALPAVQSLVQMAHALAPAVPYSGLYFNVGRWFAGNGPWDSISDTYAYIGFETIGILALMPADVSLSLWLFFLLNRAQVFAFAALGFGQGGVGGSQFSPGAFIMYQEAGAAIMLALLLLWQSRRAIGRAFGALVGRPAPHDPLDPVSPRTAAVLLILSGIVLCLWARRTGMSLTVFAAMMAVFFAFALATTRLVTAAGVYVPDLSMRPRELLVGLTGAAGYSPESLSMLTYLQCTFMLEPKVYFMHYDMNDMKVLHSGRLPGRLAAVALLLAVVLMMAVAPWANLHSAYTYGAQKFDRWQFLDMGNGEFGALADSLRSPEARRPFMALGLLCGGAVMLLLNWLHLNFLWWGISPVGFIMGGTWGLNTRIWTNAFIAWLLVTVLVKIGGLRLYSRSRPVFLGMVLGHCVIMAVRSMLDPVLGLRMFLTPW
jgi:hypothetical protein